MFQITSNTKYNKIEYYFRKKLFTKKEILYMVFTGRRSFNGKKILKDSLLKINSKGYYISRNKNSLFEISSKLYYYFKNNNIFNPSKMKLLPSDWGFEIFNRLIRANLLYWSGNSFDKTFNYRFNIQLKHWDEFFYKFLFPVFDVYFL